jgi:predicted acylesterase/phospholipase RssA
MPKPRSAAELRERNREFADASKPCDLVLKGGAASGFVYSGTIVELARAYRFQAIGGTSAGAGAAGVAAAAEYGRRSGNPEAWGIAGIEHVPEWAAERTANGWTRLKHLFGPDAETARLYEVVSVPFTARDGGIRKALVAALCGYLRWTVLGVAVAAAIVALLVWNLSAPVTLVAAIAVGVLGIATAVLFVGALVGWNIWRDLSRRIPANGFGLCRAMSEPSDAPDAPPDRMTGWLYGLYQHLAGKPMNEPLTFGDLWRAPRLDGEQGIRLSLMSVNLSLGRPVRITHDDHHETLEEDAEYWFDPADFERLFPRAVVDAMVRAAEAEPGGRSGRCLRFPRMANVPIIVGVRLSFALPILFSAVRLYRRDTTRLPLERMARRTVPESALEPCWFADGGVCTSLPIHLFDKPMPRWPTFAVNLRSVHPDARQKGSGPLRVWMDHEFATDPAHGLLREWWKRIDVDARPGDPTRFDPVPPPTQLKRLLGAMFATAIGWVDGAQLRLATCRDRVAHVCLDEREGAFNVDTDSAAIRQLAELGRTGGAKLVKYFAGADAVGWPAHRAVRYLAAMQLAARFIDDFSTGFRSGQSLGVGERKIEGALNQAGFVGPHDRPDLTNAQLLKMEQLTGALLAEEENIPEPGDPGWPDHPALKPRFVVRMMPDA